MPNTPSKQDIIRSCATTAQRLFDWSWVKEGEDLVTWNYRYLSAWAIPQICRSYGAYPAESRLRLRQTLELLGSAGYPIECVYAICSNIEPIIAVDPSFAGEIYRRVFGYEERSEDRTHFGGVVLPMLSNRRQDYEMCHYQLIEKFDAFVKRAPEEAIATGIDTLGHVILVDHVAPSLEEGATVEQIEESFDVRGQPANYIRDFSHIWDRSAYPDRELEIADAISQHFMSSAEEGDQERFSRDLHVFVNHARPAFFWKRLLETGAERPAFFAEPLHPLCIARPIMAGSDTVFALGSFLESAVEHWSDEQRLAVEERILGLTPAEITNEAEEGLEHFRDRLLMCLPTEYIQTAAGKILRERLAKSERAPRNEPLVTFDREWKSVTTEEFLRERGTAVDEPSNAALLTAARSLEQIRSTLEKKVLPEDIARSVDLMRSALALLSQHAKADPKVRSNLRTQLSSASVQLVRRFSELTTEQAEFVRDILLSAVEDSEPVADEERDSKWNHASWSPAPRNDAAQGVAWLLLLHPDDEKAKAALRDLLNDKVPSVRFLAALELFRLHLNNTELMSAMLAQRASIEQNPTVLHGICISLHNTLHLPSSRKLVRVLYARIKGESEPSDYHDDIIAMIVDIAISSKEEWASDLLKDWIANLCNDIAYLSEAADRLVEYITPTIQERFRDTAYVFAEQLINRLLAELLRLHTLENSSVQDQDRNTANALYRIIDHIIARLYFAFDFDNRGLGRGERVPNDDQRHAFFVKLMPLFDSIVKFANNDRGWLLAPTAHHLMQLLGDAVNYDPNNVLRLAAGLAQGSVKGRYPFDSLAIKEVVELVERILADHRGEIREPTSFQNLLQLLDIFASAGWPEALRLVWRLDEVYR